MRLLNGFINWISGLFGRGNQQQSADPWNAGKLYVFKEEVTTLPDGDEALKLRNWDLIMRDKTCPVCGAKKSMLQGPSGAAAFNLKCSNCESVYCLSEFRPFGAERIR